METFVTETNLFTVYICFALQDPFKIWTMRFWRLGGLNLLDLPVFATLLPDSDGSADLGS